MKTSLKPKLPNKSFEKLFDKYVDAIINAYGLPSSLRNQIKARVKMAPGKS